MLTCTDSGEGAVGEDVVASGGHQGVDNKARSGVHLQGGHGLRPRGLLRSGKTLVTSPGVSGLPPTVAVLATSRVFGVQLLPPRAP
jgi:hypothetical protein